MSKKQLPIQFKLVHIEEKQFASFDDVLENENPIEQEIGFGFGVDIEQRVIGVTMKFILHKQKLPLIKLETACYFEIESEAFKNMLIQAEEIELPCGFGKHLAMITIGTARGILFANTKNTAFNKFLIGLVNVNEMFKENIRIEL